VIEQQEETMIEIEIGNVPVRIPVSVPTSHANANSTDFGSSASASTSASEVVSTPASTSTSTPAVTSRLPDTKNPFELFHLQSPATKRDIKNAYRKMALEYHPDALITYSSSEEERKVANEDFAKINAAYSKLLRKLELAAKRKQKQKRTFDDWDDHYMDVVFDVNGLVQEKTRKKKNPYDTWNAGMDDEAYVVEEVNHASKFQRQRRRTQQDDDTHWHASSGEGGVGHVWIN